MTDEQVIQGFLNNGGSDEFRGDNDDLKSENLRTTHNTMFLETIDGKEIAEWNYVDLWLEPGGGGYWEIQIDEDAPLQYIKIIEHWAFMYKIDINPFYH